MNNVNSLIIDGHLAGDPVEKEFDGKRAVGFKVKMFRTYKNAKEEECEKVIHIPVVVYGGMQKSCLDFLKEGDVVRVLGRIEDIQDGNGSDLVCVADRIDFSSKNKSDEIITIDCENGAANTSSSV